MTACNDVFYSLLCLEIQNRSQNRLRELTIKTNL